MSVDSILTEERARKLFNQFDTDSSGCITFDNLRESFTRLGRASEVEADEQINAMIKLHDYNEDGKIDVEEFMFILRSADHDEMVPSEQKTEQGFQI